MRPAASYDLEHQIPFRDHLKTLRKLWLYVWPTAAQNKDGRAIRWRVVFSLSCLLLTKLATVGAPVLFKEAIDRLSIESMAYALPAGFVLAYGLARIAQSVFRELRDFLFVRVSQHARRSVALETFWQLHQLSLDYHLKRQTGGLSRVIERGVQAVRMILSFLVFNIGPTILELLMVSLIVFYFFNIYYVLIIIATVSIYALLTIRVTQWRLKYRQQMNQSDNNANTRAIDSLLNFETVKYFGNEAYEHERYDRALREFEDAAIRSQGSLFILNFGQQLTIGLGSLAILLLAVDGVLAKSISLGDFVMLNTYMLQLFLPLNFLGFVYREVRQALIDMDHMFAIHRLQSSVADRPDAKKLVCRSGDLQFKQVSFRYDDRLILDKLSLHLKAGETLAIVGPSGAGKSTISRILMRLYDVQDGSIEIDGQDIRSVTQSSLRQVIGIVPQDTVLFHETIAYNIGYGKAGCSREEIKQAAMQAQLGPLLEKLDKGLDTLVGERGLKLSGGEKQRVAIARAILRNPKILVLDEATSALDTKTERDIQEQLQQLAAGRSMLVIAHRLSTIVHAQHILVLQDGVVVERGRHDELLAAGGVYAHMWQVQQHEQQ